MIQQRVVRLKEISRNRRETAGEQVSAARMWGYSGLRRLKDIVLALALALASAHRARRLRIIHYPQGNSPLIS